jgi:predicted permease
MSRDKPRFVSLTGRECIVPRLVATRTVTVFEAAMAPMIGASIVAIDHELDPPLVTLMVGLGIPLSFVTLPVWWRLLGTMQSDAARADG